MITYVSGQLTINKAALTIQADPKKSVYGKDLEELTYTATGFVNGETLKNLGFAPRISSTVTRTSDAGAYPITFSDNYTSDNYEVSYIDGKYVILPASQKITWRPKTVLDVEDGDVYLTATASSNLPVVFNSANDAVAYVNQIGDTWTLTPVSSGSLTVTAMQHGNKNYNAAEPVTVTFIVDGEYLSVGNEKITASDHIEVYPRLFTHSVTVAAPSEIKQVELLTMSGVLQHVISKPGSVIDLSSFGPGMYLLNVTLEDGTFKSVKIIKK
ncbi:MAG: T9SS type A sorting domain-containing protein [Parabacteroides sp.]|nr:T9SS type A sorting domain-containing protein [Parabacteroides sp.]